MPDLSWRRLRRDYLTTVTVLRLVPVGVVIATGIVATGWTHALLSEHRDLVVHTHEVITITKDVLIGLDDAETGQRGYLLSSDRRYLDPYEKAQARLANLRPELAAKVSDNPAQESRIQLLDVLIDRKLGELAQSIALHDAEGFEAARRQEIAMMERATMDEIREDIGEITEGEKALLAIRTAKVDDDEHRVRVVAVLLGLASFLTRAAVEMYLTRKGLDVRPVSGDTAV
ncbi:CHASE3 domain-containing protein [Aureimonas sp. AU12]|uniref:CHASE3 domain-containing protein n=1 Tax=Aureimonas sp. AU12 TaxID=1638161 RepID=UPI0007844004|nr:CHASE3 domain-containing protein [Aureimonas sp. AU12]